jgi:hypothetical protein
MGLSRDSACLKEKARRIEQLAGSGKLCAHAAVQHWPCFNPLQNSPSACPVAQALRFSSFACCLQRSLQ